MKYFHNLYENHYQLNMAKYISKISARNTELIELNEFDFERLHFDPVSEKEIQQGNKVIKYYNIQLGSKNGNGVGELILNIPFFAHSFGIEEFQK